MDLSKATIRQRLTAMTVLSSAVGLLLAAAALIIYARVSTRTGFERDLQTVASIVADNSTGALVFNDRRAAADTLAALRAKPEIQIACLYAGSEPGAFSSYAAHGNAQCPPKPDLPGIYDNPSSLTLVSPVQFHGETIGVLRLSQTLEPLNDSLRGQVAITFSILALSFGVSLAIASGMQRSISRPIVALAGTARHVSETRDYGLRAEEGGGGEIGNLVEDFNRMLGALEAEAAAKTRTNRELAGALQQLRETQAQLVQSEKMASLGALVAGVAHEINTPIGVSVTAASTLQARSLQLRNQYESESMKRSDLDRYVGIAEESTRIILANLNRAADLIHSFKQVAVDQSSGERRRFDLKNYLDEVLLSLGPRLRKTGHTVSVDCPAGLWVNSYPGALAQILTNFISNSLLHAFAPGEAGRIAIAAQPLQEGWTELTYRDDGCGIPPDNLARIFDPFFTTKRGAGGSGLGMHIVYNLVTQMMGGQISVQSVPGKGTEFRLRFPTDSSRQRGAPT